jgi:predicted Rossmann-fold nucleotide-binding protein
MIVGHFKIMAEFVSIRNYGTHWSLCFHFWVRTKPEDSIINLLKVLPSKSVKLVMCVITGGGPGIMEAGNKGAHLWRNR